MVDEWSTYYKVYGLSAFPHFTPTIKPRLFQIWNSISRSPYYSTCVLFIYLYLILWIPTLLKLYTSWSIVCGFLEILLVHFREVMRSYQPMTDCCNFSQHIAIDREDTTSMYVFSLKLHLSVIVFTTRGFQ